MPGSRLCGVRMKCDTVISNSLFLSLGSNMGDSREALLTALVELDRLGIRIRDVSSIYRTEPVGYVEQEDFLNMVVRAETHFEPAQALEVCQAVEKKLGRVRQERWGPRIIDIDILFYNDIKINENTLQIPHPRIAERAFVLIPLREIAPTKFKELKLFMPKQKVFLQITRVDVTISLHEKGVSLVQVPMRLL